MSDFFGFGGYTRPIDGFMSMGHLTVVSITTILMIVLAILLGIRNRKKDEEAKNKVLIWSALLIDGFEIFKIILVSFRANDPFMFLQNLPLFLCSIQLITIPLAAFSKGRIRESAIDFVAIFGLLGGLAGTWGAANIYNVHPAFSFDPIVSAITHGIAGFASLYIMISGMTSMKKKNIPITYIIVVCFCVVAYVANRLIGYNYMFLMTPEGTPYQMFYDLYNGNMILYSLTIPVLFMLYASLYYLTYSMIKRKNK